MSLDDGAAATKEDPVEPGDALEALGLRGPAGPDEVKRAYRRLARRLHPDAGGDAERFRTLQLAFELIREGTDARVDGPRAQVHVAGVEQRWWEAPGAWHEQQVDVAGVDLDATPTGRATSADVDLLASLLVAGGPPVRPTTLHSRAPGSRLHRIISWLQPDLLATLTVRPADDGPRPGHDVRIELRAPAGRGRRLAGDVPLPTGWTRRRGADSVRIARDLRPCRVHEETAVRVAQDVDRFAADIDWPLDEWFVLASGDDLPT